MEWELYFDLYRMWQSQVENVKGVIIIEIQTAIVQSFMMGRWSDFNKAFYSTAHLMYLCLPWV